VKNLKAIILAAGRGKRLNPLTDKIPKAMVKLFGKSLLEWQINVFRNCNINDISIVTGYKEQTW
jgi:CTP:phosphocholine cytidylyltransferase-like protein